MKWRCLNDCMGYCSDKPVCDEQMDVLKGAFLPDEPASYSFHGGKCKLDPATCGKHQTTAEHYKGLEAPPPSYKHKVVVKEEA